MLAVSGFFFFFFRYVCLFVSRENLMVRVFFFFFLFFVFAIVSERDVGFGDSFSATFFFF